MITKRKIFIFLTTIIMLIIALFLGVMFFFFEISREKIDREDLASPHKAAEIAGFPLVGSATNVSYYTIIGGLQYGQLYMRETVALSDITNQIKIALIGNNTNRVPNIPFIKSRIDFSKPASESSRHQSGGRIDWWNPDKITNGYFIGPENHGACVVWVDQSSGTLYIKSID